MLKYPCLVLDHDDTVVQSEATVNYPCFCEFLRKYRPGVNITLKDYIQSCYRQDFTKMCREKYGFTQQELDDEYTFWKAYVRTHLPAPFPGIEKLIRKQKSLGGIICVVSHSTEEMILRDYQTHFGLSPDLIFGWDLPPEQRKPDPYPLTQIMSHFQLRPEELLVVDDMRPAWEMARKVNVPIAFAGWGKQDCPQILQEMRSLCNRSFDTVTSFHQFLFQE